MPKTTGTIQGTATINRWGGVYESGRSYTLRDKFRVSTVYEKHRARAFPMDPSISKVAKEAQVSRRFVSKVLRELKDGGLVDPELVDKTKSKATGVCGFLDIEHELFLLGLRAENPARSNQDYCNNLLEGFGVAISLSSISNFFLKRFDHTGKFKKAILIPLDKFKVGNQARYFEFMWKVKRLQDHTRWVFFDEKHLVNKDTLPGKVRANPLTGHVDAIGVNGDFRDAFNLITAISCNVVKSRPMVYTMGKKMEQQWLSWRSYVG
jgi:hypothetical protein